MSTHGGEISRGSFVLACRPKLRIQSSNGSGAQGWDGISQGQLFIETREKTILEDVEKKSLNFYLNPIDCIDGSPPTSA
jgi:hypothetical protein